MQSMTQSPKIIVYERVSTSASTACMLHARRRRRVTSLLLLLKHRAPAMTEGSTYR